jgi:hypothetical protein
MGILMPPSAREFLQFGAKKVPQLVSMFEAGALKSMH